MSTDHIDFDLVIRAILLMRGRSRGKALVADLLDDAPLNGQNLARLWRVLDYLDPRLPLRGVLREALREVGFTADPQPVAVGSILDELEEGHECR